MILTYKETKLFSCYELSKTSWRQDTMHMFSISTINYDYALLLIYQIKEEQSYRQTEAKQLNKIIVFFSMSNRCCDIWGLYNENDQREKTSNKMTIQNNAFKAMTTIVSQSREISATLHNPIHVLFSNFVFIRSSIFFCTRYCSQRRGKKQSWSHIHRTLNNAFS